MSTVSNRLEAAVASHIRRRIEQIEWVVPNSVEVSVDFDEGELNFSYRDVRRPSGIACLFPVRPHVLARASDSTVLKSIGDAVVSGVTWEFCGFHEHEIVAPSGRTCLCGQIEFEPSDLPADFEIKENQ